MIDVILTGNSMQDAKSSEMHSRGTSLIIPDLATLNEGLLAKRFLSFKTTLLAKLLTASGVENSTESFWRPIFLVSLISVLCKLYTILLMARGFRRKHFYCYSLSTEHIQ